MIRVLLADDHAIVRASLRAWLETTEDIVVVGEVADGRNAVTESLRLRPDVVVLDIAMPEMNGIEVAYQIHYALPGTRLLILSMYATSEHIARALHAGAQGYILKEAAGDELIQGIRMLLTGRCYFSSQLSPELVKEFEAQYHATEATNPLNKLSPRERDILGLVVSGKTSAEIGELVALSLKSVETYRSSLMQKLGIHDIPTLVKFAIKHGLTSLQ